MSLHFSRFQASTNDLESSRPVSFFGRPHIRWITRCVIALATFWTIAHLFSNLFFFPLDEYPRPPPPPPDFDRAEQEYLRPPRPYYPIRRPRPLALTESMRLWSSRADAVKQAFVHAYQGYRKAAFPHDELLPVSGGKVDNFNGWGVTIFDAMDTMWIMGLGDMFDESVEFAANSTFFIQKGSFAPFFETIIRYLGGLLSAYALSGEPILLSRADDLGKMLLPAFNTLSGLPMYAVNTVTGETRLGWSGSVLWAEALSNQLEYKFLAHMTGRPEYFEKSERVMSLMHSANITDGIYPTMWDLYNGKPSNDHFSVGAYADSAHEYFLKQWLLTGRTEHKARDMYLQASNAIIENLLYLTPNRRLLYVTDTHKGVPTHIFEHLSCFLPGVLALGAHTLHLSPKEKDLHQWAAEGLAYTCWLTYADQATGLGPDVMMMSTSNSSEEDRWITHLKEWQKNRKPGGVPPGLEQVHPETGETRDYSASRSAYLLRPETVESFYILWKFTGNEKWRERGWTIFQSIEKHCKTAHGYASVVNVNQTPVTLSDEMPSYFLAETLKYLFLLFTDDDLVPLEQWIFNTEAHPLPIFKWRPWEMHRYNISA